MWKNFFKKVWIKFSEKKIFGIFSLTFSNNSFSVLELFSVLECFNVFEFLNNGFSVFEFLNNGFSVLDCFSALERISVLGRFIRFGVLDLANVLGSPMIYKYSSPSLVMIFKWFLNFDTFEAQDSYKNNSYQK